MNKLTIIGNLTRDPESRTVNTQNGPQTVCTFTVAVNRRNAGQNQADFFRVTCWRKLAESCAKWLVKGKKVYVSGPVSVSTYQSQDGATRSSLEVTADDVEFLSPANETRGEAYDSDVSYSPKQSGGYTVVNDEPPF